MHDSFVEGVECGDVVDEVINVAGDGIELVVDVVECGLDDVLVVAVRERDVLGSGDCLVWENVVAEVPVVIPLLNAQSTALV